MAAVQFYSSENLLTFCDAKEFDCWGIYSGKDLVTSGEGSEELSQFLKYLEPGGSAAVYSLKLYKNADPEDIDAKTPAFCKVNFKLGSGQSVGSMNASALEQRLAGIEKKLSEKEETDESEKGKDLTEIIMGYLREPQKLAVVLGAVRGLFAPGPAAMPAAVGTVTPQSQQKPEVMNSEQIDRLGAAIDVLEKKDPKIVEHLEKLAQIANEKPAVFSMLLTMLDNNAV